MRNELYKFEILGIFHDLLHLQLKYLRAFETLPTSDYTVWSIQLFMINHVHYGLTHLHYGLPFYYSL